MQNREKESVTEAYRQALQYALKNPRYRSGLGLISLAAKFDLTNTELQQLSAALAAEPQKEDKA